MLAACGGGGGDAPPPVVVNQAPQVTSAPVTTAAVEAPYAYDVDAADPEGETLAYSLAQAPAGMVIDATSGLVTWSPSSSQAGNHTVIVRVADRGGLAATQAFSIAVTAANAAPRITATPPATGVVGAAYRHDVDAVDPDGDTLSYALTQAPAGMTIDAGAGRIAWTPSAAQAGSHAVTVRVADPSGLATTLAFSITVTVGNAAPEFTSAPVTAAVAGVAYAYAVRAVDANGDALAYSLTRAPAGMTIDAASGLVAWTPTPSQAGSHAVTVRTADPAGLFATQAFSVTVTVANAAPQITSTPPPAAVTGQPYSYLVVATDPNGDALSHSLAQAPQGMTIQAASGLVTWTPSSTQTGPHAVTVRAADPAGLAATQPFTITVAAPNLAPQITSTPATTAVVGAPYSHDVDAVDANGDALTYSLAQAPSGMSIHAGTGLIAWTPTAAQAGTRVVEVRVVDAGGLAATQTFSIVVTAPNAAPGITSAPVPMAAVGAAYAYDVEALDPNGDVLTYSLTQAPAGMTIQATTGLITWTPSYAQAGRQAVAVRVLDPAGLAATQEFDIAVGGVTRVDMATPATASADAGGTVAITLNWLRIPMSTNALQFMHFVNSAGQAWSVDDHWTSSATWSAGGFSETRTITVPAGLPSGTYDIRIGLSGGNPWGNFALAAGPGVTDPAGDRRYKVGTLTVTGPVEPVIGPMMMDCADGPGWQCSGETVLRTDNGVALSRSGVQVYGRSTSDMGANNPNLSSATGLALAGGGVAEIRVRKDGNAAPTDVATLLSNIGIFWSGQQNRPQIIETFNPSAGRVFLDGGGAIRFDALPQPSDLSYYDYAYVGVAGTRFNYANNRYFPRADPARCVPGGWCTTYETDGLQFGGGSWRYGGNEPDSVNGIRNHEDGDVHAGNGLPDGNGNPTWLPGGTGFGVPMPGSKGYRTIDHRSYRYGNLAAWFTQDTVNISEWGGIGEHNKNRRGFVAFGETTDPAAVPTGGTATYVGVVRGRHSAYGSDEPVAFTGTVTVVVNFASRSVTVSIQNTPVDLTAATVLASGANANYLTGPAASAALAGGLSGRFFGPVEAGGSGNGPAEVGGAFSLTNGGAVAIGGFIARKQ
ncbi:MAG: putative Ig domain-containing protein [Burkholderiales bacterium]|nr:putative Ig domain-containing protein [Burkholderiales bacterium]